MEIWWDAAAWAPSDAERLYCRWIGHRSAWHDMVELGPRVAAALVEQNPAR